MESKLNWSKDIAETDLGEYIIGVSEKNWRLSFKGHVLYRGPCVDKDAGRRMAKRCAEQNYRGRKAAIYA